MWDHCDRCSEYTPRYCDHLVRRDSILSGLRPSSASPQAIPILKITSWVRLATAAADMGHPGKKFFKEVPKDGPVIHAVSITCDLSKQKATPGMRLPSTARKCARYVERTRSDVAADSKDGDGWTQLSRAADGGHTEIVQLLLARSGVAADLKDEIVAVLKANIAP
jgi:hypothetical protein